MIFKTKPLAHQLKEHEEHKEDPLRALWWDMGTGKTKTILDYAAALYRQGKIDGMLVLAPGGVEDNWILDEIPKHLPDDVAEFTKTMAFSTKEMHTKRWQAIAPDFLKHEGLAILAMSYDAMMTERKRKHKKTHRFFGAEYARAFLGKRRCLYICDEGTYIKNAGTKTTKRVMASAKYAPYRRLLNGTPVIDSPMHAYTQLQWIDPTILAQRGIGSFAEFKVFFGEWEKRMRKDGRMFPNLVRFRNLDILAKCLVEAGTRVLKGDVLDLPPKVYTKVYYDLTSKQRTMYDALKNDYVASFADGSEITAELAIQRLVRLQQVCSGYLPADDDWDEPLREICTEHPRVQALRGIVERTTSQGTIWCKYNIDAEQISALLTKMDESHVVYCKNNRNEARYGFQDGKYCWFIAKQSSSAARGLTLTAATTVVYFNNNFVLDDRAQSEDRAHRHGQENKVTYIDIVARDTVDEHILAVLRRKRDISQIVTGDAPESWV